MNENAMNILLEKLGNVENRQHALEIEFIDYIEKNPKSNDQWTEQRLRALEEIIKRPPVMVSQPDKPFNFKTFKAEDSLDTRVNNLECAFAQHKQVYDVDLKRVGSELKILFKYTNDDRVKLESESDHHDWHENKVLALESFKAWAEDNIKKLQERDTQTRMMIVDLLKDFIENKTRLFDLEAAKQKIYNEIKVLNPGVNLDE